jgi:hypothetical protein
MFKFLAFFVIVALYRYFVTLYRYFDTVYLIFQYVKISVNKSAFFFVNSLANERNTYHK